jgi:predicted acyltransferase
MAFSMHKYEVLGDKVFWKKVLKRSLIIFLLGFLMYWFPFVAVNQEGAVFLKPIAETRIMGVLQRIAICYLLGSVMLHYFKTKTVVILSGVLLLSYWIIMVVFGDFTMEGNAGQALDLFLLGANHLYHGEGIAFDPEGILSTFPALVNLIAGYLAGNYIRKKGNTYEVISKMLMIGALLIFSGLAWDMVFPINKKLWTSSYVLLTIGIDLIVISLLVYSIEILNKRKWTYFFEVFGKNPLFIYLLSEVGLILLLILPSEDNNVRDWLFRDVLGSVFNPLNASLFFAVSFMLLNWLVGWILDKRKIYIRL